MLQMCHIAVDKFARDSLAVVGSFGMGQTKVTLEVARSHTMVGLKIEFEDQAGLDKKFVIETHPAFEGQMGIGVPSGAMDRIEQRQ